MSDEALKATESEQPEGETTPEAEVVEAEEVEVVEEEVSELAAAQAELADWKARAYRAAADMENVKKRHIKERTEQRKYAAQNIMRDLLPVYDNLERAIEHAPDPNDALAQGVQMVLRQFTDALQGAGARTFEAKGEPFDPQIHEAMSQMPTAEVPPGHVAQVFQRGWYLHDRLVRPAMVIVATEPPAAAEPAAADEAQAGDTQPYQAVFTEAADEGEGTAVEVETEQPGEG